MFIEFLALLVYYIVIFIPILALANAFLWLLDNRHTVQLFIVWAYHKINDHLGGV